jgi:hypothetical protein
MNVDQPGHHKVTGVVDQFVIRLDDRRRRSQTDVGDSAILEYHRLIL